MKLDHVSRAVKKGLSNLRRQDRKTAVEYSDNHFYMSSESSYIEGKWTTTPGQVAILNAMGNDLIRDVNWIKSARTGYTKLICCAINYFISHKQRHVSVWQADDGSRDRFSKKHIDTMIRDVKSLLDLFPWYDKKHKNNNIEQKSFSNRKELYLLGGKAAKNYREISVDVAILDELSKFDNDVESEGSPLMLSDKRTEGAAFRKHIRGSSPGIEGECLISEASMQTEQFFRRMIPCSCCGEAQVLKFGSPDTQYGLKFGKNLPEEQLENEVMYQCEHCHDYFSYSQFISADSLGYYESDQGMVTYDGVNFFDAIDHSEMQTPYSVTFHLWTAYSHFSHWIEIVKDFKKIKNNRNRLKTFVNTTLGEAFEDDVASKLDADELYSRREAYAASVPNNAYYLTGGFDMQDNRVEGTMWAWGDHGEKFLVDSFVLFGNPDQPKLWADLENICRRKYKHTSGHYLGLGRVLFDSGGHYAQKVHEFSKRMGSEWVIPCRGSSSYNNPIATMNKKKDVARDTYMVMVGTDTAKDEIFGSFLAEKSDEWMPGDPIPGATHFPRDEIICNKAWFGQLCSESKKWKTVGGKRQRVYAPKTEHARNEALDCTVYATAAYYVSLQYFGLNMAQLKMSFEKAVGKAVAVKKKKKSKAGTVTGGM